jgi:hypothetical protein
MRSTANKSVEKNRNDSSKYPKALRDAIAHLKAKGMSLDDIQALGHIAKDEQVDEEHEVINVTEKRRPAPPTRSMPLLPASEEIDSSPPRAKTSVGQIGDAEDVRIDETQVPAMDTRQVKQKHKDEKLNDATLPRNNRANTSQKVDKNSDHVKKYDVDMNKLFKWAKNRNKLERGKLPKGAQLGRLVTHFKNSVRYQERKQSVNDANDADDVQSQQAGSSRNSLSHDGENFDDDEDNDSFSDIEDQMICTYLLIKRGLRKFRSVEQKLDDYIKMSRRK